MTQNRGGHHEISGAVSYEKEQYHTAGRISSPCCRSIYCRLYTGFRKHCVTCRWQCGNPGSPDTGYLGSAHKRHRRHIIFGHPGSNHEKRGSAPVQPVRRAAGNAPGRYADERNTTLGNTSWWHADERNAAVRHPAIRYAPVRNAANRFIEPAGTVMAGIT